MGMGLRGARKLAPIATVIAAMSLVAGCSGSSPSPEPLETDKKTESASTPEPESSSTPSATPTPSPTPSAAASPTGSLDEQLEATAQAFFDGVTKAYQTMDPQPIIDMSDPSGACSACGEFVEVITTAKSEGQRYADIRPWKVTSFKVTKRGKTPEAIYEVRIGGGKAYDQNGKLLEDVKPSTSSGRLIFVKGEDGWKVGDNLDAE
ncbi:MAG TPA: hypothetical protein VI076_11060 [Actinopolymorphaceae bacterium]